LVSEQAREIVGLQNDKLPQHRSVLYNSMEQIHAKLRQQQLPTFKDNLALHHIDLEG